MTKWFYIERKFTKAHNNKIRGKTFALGVILETILRLICQVIFNSPGFSFNLKKDFGKKGLTLNVDFSFTSEDYNHAKKL